MNTLAEWQNFYVIVGSAAAGLTGLQFVVIALVADMTLEPEESAAGTTFSTPTIVHFCAVLLLSAIAVMPWHTLAAASVAWGVAGAAGAVYTAITAARMRRQQTYKTVAEDWLLRVVVPLTGYLLLSGFAVLARCSANAALFGVAAVALVLLFTGIHNAWDNVTYLVFEKKQS